MTTTATPARIVRDAYQAIARNDVDTLQHLLADDVVLHVPGTHPLAGDHHGHDGFFHFILESRALTQDGEQIEVIDLLDGTDHAAAYCRITARRPDGSELTNTTVHLLRVRDGLVAEIWFHNWDDLAVNDFWS